MGDEGNYHLYFTGEETEDPDSLGNGRRELGTAVWEPFPPFLHLISLCSSPQVCDNGRRGPSSRSLNSGTKTALQDVGNTKLRRQQTC